MILEISPQQRKEWIENENKEFRQGRRVVGCLPIRDKDQKALFDDSDENELEKEEKC